MKTYDLVAAIFEDCQTPYVYVAAPMVIDSEKQLYDPLLSAMRRLSCYNGFDGRKVADFLRKNLVAENKDGRIIRVCFGREYSPALYLTFDRLRCQKGPSPHLSGAPQTGEGFSGIGQGKAGS